MLFIYKLMPQYVSALTVGHLQGARKYFSMGTFCFNISFMCSIYWSKSSTC